MSVISKANIEFWFFQYHEGLLSESEKAQLMNYLYEHPEYNEDFVLWANTKLIDDVAEDTTQLEKSILRQRGFSWPSITWKQFIGFSSALLILIGAVLLWPKDSSEQGLAKALKNAKIKTVEPILVSSNSTKENALRHVWKNLSAAQIEEHTNFNELEGSSLENHSPSASTPESGTTLDTKMNVSNDNSVDENPVASKPSAEDATVPSSLTFSNQQVSKKSDAKAGSLKNQKQKKMKYPKVKQKTKLDLRPTDEFLKDNPDL
ncbi:MAG: hypothetical protein MUF42_00710 [Cytophagaceae bacterium]|jgi:hypothetical protein|nr:hypothetical protein [Cytophagaceae bacterium]